MGRMSLLAFVAASAAVHGLPRMPGRAALLGLCIAALLCTALAAWRMPGRRRWHVLAPLWMALAGFLLTVARVEHRLADRLDAGNENKVSRVVLRIAGLPRLGPDSRQFEAEVISSIPEGVPSRIQVSWTADQWAGPYGRADRAPARFPELIPGQVWRMALTLKPPHGTRNPQAFDYESHAFAHGIRALGSVRGQPKYMHEQPWASLPVVAQRARHAVRKAMQPYLQDKRYGAVLLALAIGDQASVQASDWLVFNRSGITHLVSISGSHITMIAALGGLLVLFLWRRMRWRGQAWSERLPAQVAAALAALLVAWLYCLLAGWGVPARRTFFMLAVIFLMYILRLSTTPSRVLSLVAFVLVLLDPWALLASGFWLSFGAVYVLMTSSGWHGQAMAPARPGWRRAPGFLAAATRLQLAITGGLMPLLAIIFHEVSLVSPLVNAYAIPVISLLVTPLALLLAGAAMVPGLELLALSCAWLGHAALDAIMAPTVWLSELRAASLHVAAAPLWLTVVAMLGLAWATLPYGMPGRHPAWLLVAPALLWGPGRPPDGSWNLHALDIGQGSAILIQTRRHAVLFDTGVRSSATSDAGARIIWPFLRAQGVRRLGALIVSHADIDHAGGVRSILEALPVAQSYSSFDLLPYLEREARLLGIPDQLPPLPPTMSSCTYGMKWHVDGVTFEFLWPLATAGAQATSSSTTKTRNARACVLRVRGRYHTALLTADIGSRQETDLLARGLGRADVVMAAHHGSRTSSSAEFVAGTQAAHVVAQAGAWNRYGHPAKSVQARWQDSGARFWRTDHDGAISFYSRPDSLRARSERTAARRYWQHEMEE